MTYFINLSLFEFLVGIMSHQIVAMIIPLVFLCHLGFVLTEVCNGQNEVFSDCGGCDQQCGGTGSACGESCVRGCFCIEGFKRNFEGKCVEESQCFVCPGINEYFTTCGNKCTEQCNKSYEICSDQCQVGCFCKSGYKRNARGECVSPEHCCCDPNEEFKYGNECIEKCGATICTMGLTQGCFCKSGYKRELRTKKCIPECQCPKGSKIFV